MNGHRNSFTMSKLILTQLGAAYRRKRFVILKGVGERTRVYGSLTVCMGETMHTTMADKLVDETDEVSVKRGVIETSSVMVTDRFGPGNRHFYHWKMTANIMKDVNMKNNLMKSRNFHSLGGATVTYAAYTFLEELLRVSLRFKNVPTQNRMFCTRVPLELSQVVVTLDCISTRKLSLFCFSNIVC